MDVQDYYLVSVRHSAGCEHVPLWRPDARGYSFSLDGAGRYPLSEIARRPDYLNNGSRTFAVPVDAVLALSEAPRPGSTDEPGPVVANTPRNVEALILAAARSSADLDEDAAWGGSFDGPWSEAMAEMSRILACADDAEVPALWRARTGIASLAERCAPEAEVREAMEAVRERSAVPGRAPGR